MKNYLFLILLTLLSCKKDKIIKKVVPKNETLDLRYEVLNQIIDENIKERDSSYYFNNSVFHIPSRSVYFKLNDVDDEESKPFGIYLKYDSIFSINDSVSYKDQSEQIVNFKLNKNRINQQLNYISDEDLYRLREIKKSGFWEEFEKKYGNKCIESFSVPFFNIERNICVVEYSSSCGFLNAVGSILIYKKVNGKWVVLRRFGHWVS